MKTNKRSCILAMLQPSPLPGTYLYDQRDFSKIIQGVEEEARVLSDLGYDGFILQNMHDGPIRKHAQNHTIAYMTAIAQTIKKEYPEKILGILINWDGVASLCVASASGADFVRVEYLYTGVSIGMCGLVEGQCAEILDLKRKLGSDIPVYADAFEASGVYLNPIPKEKEAIRMVKRAFADGLFMSSDTISEAVDLSKTLRKSLNVPLFIGGKATGDNIEELMRYYDGVSVSTWIKDGDMRNPINIDKAKLFVDNAKRGWENRYDG